MLKSVKYGVINRAKIPSFHGKNDPDAYIEWEKKIKLVFDCQHYNEMDRVRVAATEFYDYALNWWDQIVISRRRNQEFPVESWAEMKMLLRKRFVPSHYHRDLHNKLRRLAQGNRSVEDYYQELELLMIRVDLQEASEATMSRFLGGLNREIQDRLELQDYINLEEMLHKAVLVEQQVKRKGVSRPSYGSTNTFHKPTYPKDDRFGGNKPTSITRPDFKATTSQVSKDKIEFKTSNVRCFKCQGRGHYSSECTNKKIMVLKENGDFESEKEPSDSEASLEEHEEPPIRGELLVARRTLSVQPKSEEHEQRQNLFHTRCMVQGKVCSLIIDGGSCTNVASETMVKKLNLKEQKHPRPYDLQWLNENGEMRVKTQVIVPLSIGKYEDDILCDVLPMV